MSWPPMVFGLRPSLAVKVVVFDSNVRPTFPPAGNVLLPREFRPPTPRIPNLRLYSAPLVFRLWSAFCACKPLLKCSLCFPPQVPLPPPDSPGPKMGHRSFLLLPSHATKILSPRLKGTVFFSVPIFSLRIPLSWFLLPTKARLAQTCGGRFPLASLPREALVSLAAFRLSKVIFAFS